MSAEHDPEADAVYVYLSDKPYAHGTDLDDARRIDYGTDGEPIGVELLNVRLGVNLNGLPEAARLAKLLSNRGVHARG